MARHDHRALTAPRESSPSKDRPGRRTSGRTTLQLLAMAGPAFVVGCWGFGPGNLTTSIQAGSGFGYSLVWVAVAATVLVQYAGHAALVAGDYLFA